MINVCRDCKERKLGCHSICERYINEQEKHRRIKQLEKEENMVHQYVVDSTFRYKKYGER